MTQLTYLIWKSFFPDWETLSGSTEIVKVQGAFGDTSTTKKDVPLLPTSWCTIRIFSVNANGKVANGGAILVDQIFHGCHIPLNSPPVRYRVVIVGERK